MMKPKAACFYSALLIGVLGQPVLHARDRVVGPDEKIHTIKEALAQAQNGDRIIIRKGVYKEGNIIVGTSVSILGEDFPELDGDNSTEVMTVLADNVVIRGLVIKNSGVSFVQDNAGVKLKHVKNCTIEDNQFLNNFFAIYLAKSTDCRIIHNQIKSNGKREANTGNGIHLWYSHRCVIENNTIEGHRDGIYFEFVRGGTITGNVSEKNMRYGLHFMFSDSCKYVRNTFRHNGAGVAVMYTHHVEMIENQFEDNWGGSSYGLLLKEITDSYIYRNRFYRNTVGIHSEGSVRLMVSHNDFIENGWGAKILANSTDNQFLENNFIGNSFDIATNSRQNYNTFNKNYWSNYSGYDLNKDGVGDVPFRPVRLFSLMAEQNPPTLILLRSFLIDLLDVAERIFPALTPETLVDTHPMMRRVI
jgi:nitrous oxidase accessory protein